MNILNCFRLNLLYCLTIEARLVRFDKSTSNSFWHGPFQLPVNIQHNLKLIPEGSTGFGQVFSPIISHPKIVPIMPFWPWLGRSSEESISDLKINNIEDLSKIRKQNGFEKILRHFANKKGGLKSIFNKLLLKSRQQGINVVNFNLLVYKLTQTIELEINF